MRAKFVRGSVIIEDISEIEVEASPEDLAPVLTEIVRIRHTKNLTTFPQTLTEEITEEEFQKGPTNATVVGAKRIGDKMQIDLQLENFNFSDFQLQVTYDDGTTGFVTVDPTSMQTVIFLLT